MVKTHNLTLLVATIILSFVAAPIAFAGPGGTAHDSVSVAAETAGGFRVIVTDLTRDHNTDEYTYSTFGSNDDETWACGDWNGNYMYTGPAVIRDNGNGGLLWISDPNPADGSMSDYTYQLFGSPGDTPVVGDWNTAIDHLGVEVGVVREEGGVLAWYIQDFPTEPVSAGCQCSRYVFGEAGDEPAAGNWDGDPSTPWQLGYTRNIGGVKSWTTATLPPQDGGGDSITTTFGAGTDRTFQGDANADGQTVRQVARTFPDDPGEPGWFQIISDDSGGPNGSPSTFNFGNSRGSQVLLNCQSL